MVSNEKVINYEVFIRLCLKSYKYYCVAAWLSLVGSYDKLAAVTVFIAGS